MSIQNSLSDNRTQQLWQSFRPREKEIQDRSSSWIFSAQEYPSDYQPVEGFKHWAAVEVESDRSVPEGMQCLTIESGLWAVFVHEGTVKTFGYTMNYILTQWLPQSGYTMDSRPHLQIMKEEYFGPLDPRSREEVWIPISTAQ